MLFSLLCIGALRVSEICVTMVGFFVRRGASGAERWWLELTSKDGKLRLVPERTPHGYRSISCAPSPRALE